MIDSSTRFARTSSLRSMPRNDEVLAIQSQLWNSGHLRDAGPVDILIAAYAIANRSVVVSADRDFVSIAQVTPELRHLHLPAA
ncbi:hypothetical protein [Curtobacterium ammoniigenes]|uniref:hypothetical protein n=1 Tax=Curtobacterium ammoniigenes TaxID=395387 RepID=UPI000832971E|nr:hypothetical protein [Curtobacterium ammoniigenes]